MDDIQSEKRNNRRSMMLDEPPAKIIPIVAFPMIVTMLVDSVYNMADTFFVSRLGITATAAVGINDSLLQLMRAVALGFGIGAASYISRLLGAKRDEEADRTGIVTLITGMLVLTGLAVIGEFIMEPIVMFMGSTESSKQYSMHYGRIILFAAPFTAAEVILSQLLRSEGSAKYSMIGMMSGCILNIGLDPLFISVFNLEVAGAALATTLSKIVSAVILLYPFLCRKTVLNLSLSNFKPSKTIYREIAKIGIPSFIRSAMISVSGIVTNNLASSFGDIPLAAVTVANKSAKLVASVILGFGQGIQPIVGYCWGAKRYKRVRKVFWTCSYMGSAVAIFLALIMGIFAKNFIAAFTKDNNSEIIRIGVLMLRSQCLTMVFHVWAMIVNSLFQALGRVFPATVMGLSRQGLCLIPAALVLSFLFGIDGLAVSQAVADIMMTIIAIPFIISFMSELQKLDTDKSGSTLPAG